MFGSCATERFRSAKPVTALLVTAVCSATAAWVGWATGRKSTANTARPEPPLDLSSLTQRQLDALDLLDEGVTVVMTAELVGVSRTTIYEWRKNPAFATEEARRAALRRAEYADRTRRG